MKIFLDHLHKTGGTTLYEHLATALGRENASSGCMSCYNLADTLALFQDKTLISGHFSFTWNDRLPEEALRVTMLRNPLERVLSHYSMLRFNTPEDSMQPLSRALSARDPLDFFQDERFLCFTSNYQSRHFAALLVSDPWALGEEELFDRALAALSQYDYVGVTEQLDAFTRLIDAVLGLEGSGPPPRKKVTSRRLGLADLPEQTQENLAALNRVDFRLWEHARALLRRDLRRSVPVPAAIDPGQDPEPAPLGLPDTLDSAEISFDHATVSSQRSPGSELLCGEFAALDIAFTCHAPVEDLAIGYSIHHDSGIRIFGVNTAMLGHTLRAPGRGRHLVRFVFPVLLGCGGYYVHVSAHASSAHPDSFYFRRRNIAGFQVVNHFGQPFEGLVRLTPVLHLICRDEGGDPLVQESREGDETVLPLSRPTPPVLDAGGRVSGPAGPLALRPGEQAAVSATVENASDQDWRGFGRNPVSLSYHWVDQEGRSVVFDGLRTPLPASALGPGEKAEVRFLVEAPGAEGDYTLVLTLVQEGIAWLEDRGLVPATCPVAVREHPFAGTS